MFETLETFVLNIWTSLDDVILCIGALLLAVSVSRNVHWVLTEYFATSSFMAQMAHVFVLGGAVLSILSHLFGNTVSRSIFGGFSIGVGYAMQPFIRNIVGGFILRSSEMIRAGIRIQMKDTKYTVVEVGMYYTTLQPTDGVGTEYVPNVVFENERFVVL